MATSVPRYHLSPQPGSALPLHVRSCELQDSETGTGVSFSPLPAPATLGLLCLSQPFFLAHSSLLLLSQQEPPHWCVRVALLLYIALNSCWTS